MTRQAVKQLEGVGARHLAHQEVIALMLLVQHAHHRKHGIVMMKPVVKVRVDIGANQLLQQQHIRLLQVDGANNRHVHPIHATNHRSIIVMSKQAVQALGGAGVHRSMEEVVGVHLQHALCQEASAGIRYAVGVKLQLLVRAIVV